jgi:hypothetical protein
MSMKLINLWATHRHSIRWKLPPTGMRHSVVSFRSPHLFYLLTAGVEVVYYHLITLRYTPQSVGLLWTRDRPVAETSTWQHKHLQETHFHSPGEIRTHDPSKRSAADLRLRPRGHWDRPQCSLVAIYQRFRGIYSFYCRVAMLVTSYQNT